MMEEFEMSKADNEELISTRKEQWKNWLEQYQGWKDDHYSKIAEHQHVDKWKDFKTFEEYQAFEEERKLKEYYEEYFRPRDPWERLICRCPPVERAYAAFCASPAVVRFWDWVDEKIVKRENWYVTRSLIMMGILIVSSVSFLTWLYLNGRVPDGTLGPFEFYPSQITILTNGTWIVNGTMYDPIPLDDIIVRRWWETKGNCSDCWVMPGIKNPGNLTLNDNITALCPNTTNPHATNLNFTDPC